MAITPMEIYKLLPKTNCKKCGEQTCMSFAFKLINREKKLEDCTPLFEEKKYEKQREKLIDCLLYTSPSPRDLSTSRMPSSA